MKGTQDKNPASILPDDNGAVLIKLEIDPKCFQKVVMDYSTG